MALADVYSINRMSKARNKYIKLLTRRIGGLRIKNEELSLVL